MRYANFFPAALAIAAGIPCLASAAEFSAEPLVEIKAKIELKLALLVDLEKTADPRFDVVGQAHKLQEAGGKIMACGTCLKLREAHESEVCQLSSMKDLYSLVRDADRVVSF